MADLKISQLTTATAPTGGEQLALVQGGTTKKVTVTNLLGITPDGNGNVGLGVTPSAWSVPTLQVPSGFSFGQLGLAQNAYFASGWKYTGTSATTLYQPAAGAHTWYNAPSGTAGASVTWTQAMTLDASGNLMVGTTSTSGNAGGVVLKNISGLGQVVLSNNSGASDYVARFTWGSSATLVGNITVSSTATTYSTSSDRRLKTAIAPAADSGPLLDAMEVVSHDWITGGHTRFGMIAQDLYHVAPEAVTVGDTDADISRAWGVDYSKLVPLLVKEVQSLRARIAVLEA